MAAIVILEHELQRDIGLDYMVYAFAERWRARGHSVFVHHGTGEPPPGDVAINNVDLTVVPPDYQRLFARYPRVINRAVLDVSKSRFSQDLLTPAAAWGGPVIVKTEANFGGKPEHLLRAVAREKGLACDIPAGPLADGYPTYPSLREVPPAAWRTPGLMVERFLPERDERGYYLRVWIFLGTRETSSRWRAQHPIIKAEHLLEREEVPVPQELRNWRKRLGFDFGKFDYVRHGDRFVLLDVNRCPTLPAHLGERAQRLVGLLEAGVDD
jgi:hypothetical protein